MCRTSCIYSQRHEMSSRLHTKDKLYTRHRPTSFSSQSSGSETAMTIAYAMNYADGPFCSNGPNPNCPGSNDNFQYPQYIQDFAGVYGGPNAMNTLDGQYDRQDHGPSNNAVWCSWGCQHNLLRDHTLTKSCDAVSAVDVQPRQFRICLSHWTTAQP